MSLRWMMVASALVGCHSSVDLFGEDASMSRDSGPARDLTVPPADGPATACPGIPPKCYAGWSASADCCLAPGSDASCTPEGEWICPLDTFLESECGRIDPVCEGVDGGPPPTLYDDCELNSDCVLTGAYCCPTCGIPTAEDYAAVADGLEEDYYENVACPEAATDPPICPDCAEGYNPHLAATCDTTGFRPACAVVDLEAHAFTECATDSDCRLATPGCCECGEIPLSDTIAVERDADLARIFCDDALPCECDPLFEERARAVCDAGRCAVVVAAP